MQWHNFKSQRSKGVILRYKVPYACSSDARVLCYNYRNCGTSADFFTPISVSASAAFQWNFYQNFTTIATDEARADCLAVRRKTRPVWDCSAEILVFILPHPVRFTSDICFRYDSSIASLAWGSSTNFYFVSYRQVKICMRIGTATWAYLVQKLSIIFFCTLGETNIWSRIRMFVLRLL